MKPDERCFFIICWELTRDRHVTVREVIDIFKDVIPYRRMIYYLKKWMRLGFYEYGVILDLGWLNKYKMPERYLKLIDGRNF